MLQTRETMRMGQPAASPRAGLVLQPMRLHADPSRVVLRPFNLGWQSAAADSIRAAQLVADIVGLTDAQAAEEYAYVLEDFAGRHWQIEPLFQQRYDELSVALGFDHGPIPPARQRLIGAYFCHEYSYAAAALMNPSIVPHPDQSGMGSGAIRFVMSLRAVGEGHISTIAFREGIVERDGSFTLANEGPFATAAQLDNAAHSQRERGVLIHRQSSSTLTDTVLFPITEQQRGGLEDLRLTRFEHARGDAEWIGTYTAYSGHSIRSELLRTRDFCRFLLEPITGDAARNKGMALFPRRVGGSYAMLGRQDGKNLYLLRSKRLDSWCDEGTLLLGPRYPWEFIQMGNCGAPIEIEAGWLVLTHGVGAMRKYAIGAALLDREDPSKVLARSPEPILAAADADRFGYVPNVVYTCGAMRCGDILFMPYGISDSAVGFATVSIASLLGSLAAP